MSLRGRLLFASSLLIGAFGLLFLATCALGQWYVIPFFARELEERTLETTGHLAPQLDVALGSGDADMAREMVLAGASPYDLRGVLVLNSEGKVVYGDPSRLRV